MSDPITVNPGPLTNQQSSTLLSMYTNTRLEVRINVITLINPFSRTMIIIRPLEETKCTLLGV